MSTFAVFGMTRDVAMTEAKKTVKTTRPDPKNIGQKIELTVIELARKTGKCRDMRIRAKRVMVDAQGEPIINPKTKAPKIGFTE